MPKAPLTTDTGKKVTGGNAGKGGKGAGGVGGGGKKK
jgi:hypothetical protein